MRAAIFNKNTASFSTCKLSKLSVPESHWSQARVPRNDNWTAWRIPRSGIVGETSPLLPHPIRGIRGIVVGNLSMGGSSLKPTQTSSVLGFYFLGSKSPADPEHVAIRMAKVHPAGVPRHIGGRKCDLQPGGDAVLMHLVHVVDPDRHPDALVALFVSVLLKRGDARAAAAASLRP